MEKSVAEAFAHVRAVFSARHKPASIFHCSQCYTEQDIAGFLSIPDAQLTPKDLGPILWDAHCVWGTWLQIAHYIPRLLEFYQQKLIFDEEAFYARLLFTVRPDLADAVLRAEEKMTREERRSIFAFVQAVQESRIAEDAPGFSMWRFSEGLAFLAAFETPLAPFLLRLQNSKRRQVRANLCAFLAAQTLDRQPFEIMALPKFSLIPENQAALDEFLAAPSVAAYLRDHAADVSLFSPEQQADIALAAENAASFA